MVSLIFTRREWSKQAMFRTDLVAPLVRHVIAPLWAAWERSPYLREYRRLCKVQYDPPEVVRERQLQALRELLVHAEHSCPFWKQRLRAAGITAADVQSFTDYRAVPLLTKEDLRSHGRGLLSHRCCHARLTRKKTSGSTGVAVEVWVDEAALQRKRAVTLLCDEWSGWRRGQRTAMLWGNPPYRRRGWRGRLRNALLERASYLDTLSMDGAALEHFARSLERRPPALLFGHAHSLYLFAEFLRDRGKVGFQPRGIIATAMTLHDWERRSIEAVFGCPVTNRYGCEEVSLIACECEHHTGLHVAADNVYVEILRSDGSPASPGEAGAVVVTDLVNRAMPLLRYQVGDVAVASDRLCRCGRGWPLLQRLEGREADYVITADGRYISGVSLTENFAVLVPGVAQFQIVQEGLERFCFRLVPAADFSAESLQRLHELAVARFGSGVVYRVECLRHIPPEPSGKFRFCISKLGSRVARGDSRPAPLGPLLSPLRTDHPEPILAGGSHAAGG